MKISHLGDSDQNCHDYRYTAVFLKCPQNVENTLINWNNFTKIYISIDLLNIKIVQIQNLNKTLQNKNETGI